MSTLREAAIGAMGALETARNGLAWYRDRYPESTDGSDDEAAGDIDAAIDALRAELVKPDAPAAAPGGWQGLTEQERTKAVSAIEGYGTDFVAPIYAVIEGIERTLFERNTPRPAPAEPQPAAQQEPLFWYRPRSDGLYEGPIHNAQIERARKESGGWVPLYTQAGERKPLTDEQVFASEDFMSANGLYWGLPMTTLIQIVRCTERAHGITATNEERHD